MPCQSSATSPRSSTAARIFSSKCSAIAAGMPARRSAWARCRAAFRSRSRSSSRSRTRLPRAPPRLGTGLPRWWELRARGALALAPTLYGLVLTGMENSLQVTLVIIMALSLMRERLAWPFWVSVVLLPLIRYEGLAISLPVLAFLVLSPGRRVASLAAGAVIAVLGVAFRLYLCLHG